MHSLIESSAHPTQPIMLTPDYQEFPNRAGPGIRDNTVIFCVGASA
jgi:hypothetical protein